ncbi:hypothetical protein MGMO_145c00080 [Methyloglobulus morosus KoM1]|uniref:Uncharacterized protein n=1 Tax=Methyloglobulus morosus KoM1 TaxID=1116472 RepID=V5B5V1_9GAMM|nr:hypothetical protein MGMO_145c00080 [Methyloglobulus morosus KoM1]
MSEPFVLSLSKHTPPFDKLKANGNLILHKAESIARHYKAELRFASHVIKAINKSNFLIGILTLHVTATRTYRIRMRYPAGT